MTTLRPKVDTEPVYGISIIPDSNRARIIHLNRDKIHEDKLIGEALEIFHDERYTVVGNVFKCNLNGLCRKLPVMYFSISYHRTVLTGFLMNVFVYLELSEEEYKRLLQLRRMNNIEISGRYLIELECDESLVNKLKEDGLSDKYREFLEPDYIEGVVSSAAVMARFRALVRNDLFKELIKIAIGIRDEERVDQAGLDLTIATKKTIKLDKLRTDPSLLNDHFLTV